MNEEPGKEKQQGSLKDTLKKVVSKQAKEAIKKNPIVLKVKLIIIGVVFSIAFFLIILALLYALFAPIIDIFIQEGDVQEKNKDLPSEQQKFVDNINAVYQSIYSKYSVKIDRALLASTVLYNGRYEEIYENNQNDGEIDEIEESENNENDSTYSLNDKYKISKNKLNRLALMMVSKNSPYSLDKERYRDHLINTYVPFNYDDLIDQNHKERSIKQIVDDIFELASQYYALFGEPKDTNTCLGGSNCTYNVNGKLVNNLKVRLMRCRDEGIGKPIEGEELVDFEKYILGVVYAEVDGALAEAQKAEAVAARSYSLRRPDQMGNAAGTSLEKKDGQWILSIRSCTEDQVYCDPDQGCYAKNNNTGNTVHSGSNGQKQYKGPLAADDPLRAIVAETNGKVLLDSSGNIISASYRSTDQNTWNRMAKEGLDYTEILLEHYNTVRKYGAAGISTSNCASSDSPSCTSQATGSYRNWKQCNSPWSNLSLGGTSNVCKIGCLVTSISIQIARSGVETTVSPFNPGTFVTALNENGGFIGGNLYYDKVQKIAPRFKYVSVADEANKMYCQMGNADIASRIDNLIRDGCYVIVQVKSCKSGSHFVAIDKVENGTVYMMDPASNEIDLFKKYGGNVARALCYKVF